jgi:phosphoglycolate phosphatase-like HAD superfamily hydrolase
MSLGDLSKLCNVQEFSKILRSKGGALKGLYRQRTLKNQWLVLAEGHIMMDNLVKRIFAEVYLEDELFMREYGVERRYITDKACIRREKGYIEPQDFEMIRRQSPVAVVTARDQSEAQFILNNIGIGRSVDVVVSADAMGMGMADPEEVAWVRSLGVGGAEAADYATRVADAIERTRAQEALESVIRIGWVGDCSVEGRNLSALKERYGMTIIGIAFGQDPKIAAALKEKGADIVVSDVDSMVRAITERPGRARRPIRSQYPE